jgi:hypothetical protein
MSPSAITRVSAWACWFALIVKFILAGRFGAIMRTGVKADAARPNSYSTVYPWAIPVGVCIRCARKAIYFQAVRGAELRKAFQFFKA